jgi:ferric-dicitrate binding protein FerR (iron transport regulator)
MQPSDQLIFDKVSGETTLSVVDTGDATSWLDGIYTFRDTPLMDITRRLEKVYGITIQIPDETYRNERYNGTFFSNQSIEEIVEILNFKEEFVARFNNDTLILQTNRE